MFRVRHNFIDVVKKAAIGIATSVFADVTCRATARVGCKFPDAERRAKDQISKVPLVS